LDFKDRRRVVMTPNRYTELFFLDEATALAAGHRPCAECRRKDFIAYATLWNTVRNKPGRAYVKEMDPILHGERRASATNQQPQPVPTDTLPDGVFVSIGNEPHLVWQNHLWLWTIHGYEQRNRKTDNRAGLLITPPATRDILKAGYIPAVHCSAIG
ncbi:MAG: hypothetical protein ACR2OX_06745, partial [Methyloligellaceae bacterium]